ncbi:hypothetical protein [Mycolicibacterium mucogenicum]|uniref:hypothetical protein n=1 Tax=Mycolicibacterium mucogenicum TaxID=56689 RepID=UPI002B406342|nr:hypothetical protein [Mycolicibacterium mucogenicum]
MLPTAPAAGDRSETNTLEGDLRQRGPQLVDCRQIEPAHLAPQGLSRAHYVPTVDEDRGRWIGPDPLNDRISDTRRGQRIDEQLSRGRRMRAIRAAQQLDAHELAGSVRR